MWFNGLKDTQGKHQSMSLTKSMAAGVYACPLCSGRKSYRKSSFSMIDFHFSLNGLFLKFLVNFPGLFGNS